MFVPASWPGYIFAPTAGTYLITATVHWALNSTGIRIMRIVDVAAGVDIAKSMVDASWSTRTTQTLTCVWTLPTGYFIELLVYQNSGGTLNIVSEDYGTPMMSMTRIA